MTIMIKIFKDGKFIFKAKDKCTKEEIKKHETLKKSFSEIEIDDKDDIEEFNDINAYVGLEE